MELMEVILKKKDKPFYLGTIREAFYSIKP